MTYILLVNINLPTPHDQYNTVELYRCNGCGTVTDNEGRAIHDKSHESQGQQIHLIGGDPYKETNIAFPPLT